MEYSYLIRRPDAVRLDIPPAGHFQTRGVLAVIFGHDDRVRRNRAILLAEIVLPEPYLYRGTAPAHFGWHYLGGRFRRCQNRHFLLPHRLGTKADPRLRLNPKDVGFSRYERLDDAAILVWPEVLHLSMSRTLMTAIRNNVLI